MTWHLEIENISGIRSGRTTIKPGSNVVRASNWQGKSSLIRAIETVMGTAATLTAGADRGHVELGTDDDSYLVELVRRHDAVAREGVPYLSEEHLRVRAELFAFLDEDNAVRQAVRTGQDLESILTRPIEFERLDERIAELRQERDAVETEFERAVVAADKLPSIQERVTRLESELESLQQELDGLTSGDDGTGPADIRDDLSDARAERDRLTNQKGQLEATIDGIRGRLGSRRDDLEALTIAEPDDLDADLAEARDQLTEIQQEIDLLHSVYAANKRVLDAGRVDLLADIEHGLVDDSLTCWVCGGAADRASVESQLEALEDRLADRRQTAEEYRSTVEKIEARRRSVRDQRREKADLEAEIDDLESTLADREESLETVTDRIDALNARIDELESEVATVDDRLTALESDIKFTEAELEDAREELEATEQQANQREFLENERASLTDEIEALRTRKDRLKAETREAFDDAMGALLDELDPGFESARLTPNFELVVAREGREVGLDELSEGEVELLGIVTALAGHEAYDVGDDVPVILLDSVGDLAGENLGPLVAYLAERTTYLVTTAYPEQAVAEDHRIDPADWSVVSRDVASEASS